MIFSKLRTVDLAESKRKVKNRFYLFAFGFALVLSSCAILDTAGVSDSYTGKEAKEKIKEAAFISDLWSYAIIYGSKNAPVYAVMDGALVDIFLKIDDAKYYARVDVGKCADDIKNFGILLVSDGSTTTLISSNCSGIKPNGLFY